MALIPTAPVTPGVTTGAGYFSLSDLRALPNLSDTTKYPDASLTAAQAWITGIVERICNTSFVERTYTETLSGSRSGGPRVSRPYVRDVLALTVAGVPWTSGQVALTSLTPDGRLVQNAARGGVASGYVGYVGYGTSGCQPWPLGVRNIVVTYTAGYSDSPPADLLAAMLQAARSRLLSTDGVSGIPSRATSLTNEFGNVQLSTASVDRPTGIPDVDAVILGWAAYVRVPGIA